MCTYHPILTRDRQKKILDDISNYIVYTNNNKIIICGDFNAHSHSWGSRKETSRGKLVNEWVAALDLTIINKGNTSTCIRRQGESIVDLTIVSAEIINKIQEWNVIEQETLSDHKYIVTELVEIKNKHKFKNNNHNNNRNCGNKNSISGTHTITDNYTIINGNGIMRTLTYSLPCL